MYEEIMMNDDNLESTTSSLLERHLVHMLVQGELNKDVCRRSAT